MKLLASIVALCIGASAATAATYTYQLADHPDGSQQASYDYGLRLDGPGLYYTFKNGNASLIYDDVNLTATITGNVNQSTPVDQTSPVDTAISYSMSGIADAGGGFFTSTGGSGSVGATALTGKQATSGLAFLFLDDGHRLPGPTGISGRGWINYSGTNDFLFTATLTSVDPTPPVPLPAAGWLLITGFAALGFSRRRNRS